MAVVRALTQECGKAGSYVHLGATSYDIVDTAIALQIKSAIQILEKTLSNAITNLVAISKKHNDTIMLGRTHGQAALPITFGLKMAVFAMEFYRHLGRLDVAKEQICVGKFSGAVGTGAALGKDAWKIQELVMKDLDIGIELAATQIVNRDRHIEFIGVLCNIAASVEKLATEFRNLQRSELLEVAEAFDVKKQVGSSTMAHKRNPITSENISGLARVVRSFIIPTYENAIQWHERDLANSSSERFIIPHVCILVDDILFKLSDLIVNLQVFPENMRQNLDRAGGHIMAESVMQALTGKGIPRDEAYQLVRKAAVESTGTGIAYKDALLKNKVIKQSLSISDLDHALDPKNYLGSSKKVVAETEKIILRSKLMKKH
jgi:adenylosuccinate lyase